MGSKGLTKEIIVQEAVALIEESGQWVISLHELARRLQVKTPSLYNHIANTKDLQREVFRCAIHRFVENQKAAIAGKEKDEAIRAFARAYFAFASENKGLYRLIMSMPLNNDEAEKEMAVPLLETVMELLAGYGLSREACAHWQRVLFRKIRWMLIMGKKGSKAEAASTENILLPIKAMFVYSVTLSFWEFT